ncbi:peptidase domain-containing ABC transporter [Glaciecola petra]|uniref:Peptidase domain-containing ABC transporter n=1 Tax=Glaciecola petra TaxID=3075602 RepID=A0ABU2ZLY0_9ALTE|nr:peptidase domain-containing ABC transporter [Aestuariibacter sp. P117]MDT0593349.1 peptidase domain-containing ABC transporter [Aestuariibacter sp. P117]
MDTASQVTWLQKIALSKRGVPVVMQSESSECGLACIAMICQFYENFIEIRDLRNTCSFQSRGINLSDLVELSNTLGLTSRALKVSLNELKNLRLPAVLHWNLNHFVVLEKVTRNFVHINDPALGKRKLSFEKCSYCFTGIGLELIPNHGFKKLTKQKQLKLSDFMQGISGIKRQLLWLLGLSILLQCFMLVAPFYMQTIVDHIIASQNQSLLLVLALGFAILLCIDTLTTWAREQLLLRFSNQFNLIISERVFSHLLSLPMRYFKTRHMGDIVSRFGSLQNIRNIVSQGIVGAMIDSLLGVATLIVMLFYSPLLSFLVLFWVVLYALLRWVFYYPLKQHNQESLHADAKQQSYFMQSLRAITTTKLAQKEALTTATWMNHLVCLVNQQIKIGEWQIRFSTINKLLFGFENIFIIFVAASLVMENAFTLGMLFAFISYKGKFIAASTSMIDKWIEFTLLSVHLKRLEDIVFTKPENTSSLTNKLAYKRLTTLQKTQNIQNDVGARIDINELSFAHDKSRSRLFKNINTVFESGELVAIVGKSGCGKSSFLMCLLGLYEYDDGSISIDGQTLNSWNRQDAGVAGVLQDDQLLNGSLIDNICQFNQRPDYKFAIKCAQVACIHEDIMHMTMQYESLIGDMGDNLSGGQKQRLLLARALYQKPRLLVLDEATSHLDIQTEATICNNLKQLSCTIVMVAHRPQAIATANKIYALSSIGLTEISYSSDNFQPSTNKKDDN